MKNRIQHDFKGKAYLEFDVFDIVMRCGHVKVINTLIELH